MSKIETLFTVQGTRLIIFYRDREKPHLGESRNLPNFFDFEKVIDKVDSVNACSMIYRELQKALNKVPHDSRPLKARAKEIQGRARE